MNTCDGNEQRVQMQTRKRRAQQKKEQVSESDEKKNRNVR